MEREDRWANLLKDETLEMKALEKTVEMKALEKTVHV